MTAFKLVLFKENSGRQSLAIPEILAFVSYCSANFQPTLDYFIPNFKLTYEDLENITSDRVKTVIFNLHQIKHRAFFWDTRYLIFPQRLFFFNDLKTNFRIKSIVRLFFFNITLKSLFSKFDLHCLIVGTF